MNVAVIIVAAGQGVRFKSATPKPFVLLKKDPIICHSLSVFERTQAIGTVIIVGHKNYLMRLERLCKAFKKVGAVVAGGDTRAASVKNGLAALPRDIDVVLVHDAARPLVDVAMIGRVIEGLKKNKAVIAAVPLKSTIKQVDAKTLLVKATPRRDLLWEVQTPQGFRKDVLLKAHVQQFKGEATDDAMLVEAMGVKVKVVMGDYRNIKITTPEDLDIAGVLFEK